MALNLDRLEEIKIVDSGGDELAIDASGYITANINGEVTVNATDLDIRALTQSDEVTAYQGGAWSVSVTGDVNVTQGTSPWVVSGTDIDIRDLLNSQDSTAIGDESNLVDLEISDAAFAAGYGFSMYGVRRDADTSPVSADGDAHPLVFDNLGNLKVSGDLDVEEDAYDSTKATAETVGTTAVELASTPLSSRKRIIIQNRGSQSIFIGESNAVTTSTGLEVSKNSSLEYKASASNDIYAISSLAGQDVRVFEMAA